MNDSVFNPDAFLSAQTELAGETTYYPVPVGEYTHAQVKRVDVRQFSNDDGRTFTVAEIQWVIHDDEAKRVTEQDEPIARQTLWLDMAPGGGLDFGRNKNVPLSRLRDAFKQNRAGRPWRLSDFVGQSASVKVIHEADRRTGEPRAVVTAAAAL